MKFAIIVYASPYSAEAGQSAYNFSKAALAQGHSIFRLFFFADGVHNANRLTVLPQDESNLQHQWDSLIKQHQLDSVICVSSALKRGILNATEAARYELDSTSAHESSEISGLGQLVDATVQSDRVVSFG